VTLSTVAGHRLVDTTPGLRASGPRAIEVFTRLYPAEYLGDTVEGLVVAARSGLVIEWVPSRCACAPPVNRRAAP
jgi:hypothetical protein